MWCLENDSRLCERLWKKEEKGEEPGLYSRVWCKRPTLDFTPLPKFVRQKNSACHFEDVLTET